MSISAPLAEFALPLMEKAKEMSGMRHAGEQITKHYLLASDFDQTLSFNDSGIILSDLLGISGFQERIEGLSRIHLVQQGAELAYPLLHDPEYRRVRQEHLVEVGKRIRRYSGS